MPGWINETTIGFGVALAAWVYRQLSSDRKAKIERAREMTQRYAALAFWAIEGLGRAGVLTGTSFDKARRWRTVLEQYGETVGFRVDWDLAESIRDDLARAQKADAARALESALEKLGKAADAIEARWGGQVG
jgi:hypothetical protein